MEIRVLTEYHCFLSWLHIPALAHSAHPCGSRSGDSFATPTFRWLPYPLWFPNTPLSALEVSVPTAFDCDPDTGPTGILWEGYLKTGGCWVSWPIMKDRGATFWRYLLKSRQLFIYFCLIFLKAFTMSWNNKLYNMTKVRKKVIRMHLKCYSFLSGKEMSIQYLNHTLSSTLSNSWSSKRIPVLLLDGRLKNFLCFPTCTTRGLD